MQISSAGPSSVARVALDRHDELAARHRHPDRAVGPAARDRGGGDSDRGRARRRRLPCPSLPHEDGDDVAWLGSRELDVRPVRETRMRLDRRADPQQIVAGQRVPQHDCMRVADAARERWRAARRRRRAPRRPRRRPRRAVVARARPGPPRPATTPPGRRDLDLARIRLTKQPRSRDARAVSGHLGVRPVRVPDPELRATWRHARRSRARRRCRCRCGRRRSFGRGRAESGPAAGCSTST